MDRKRGDDYPSQWRLTANGRPANLTGYTVVLIARDKKTGALVLNRVPLTIVDAVNGIVQHDWQTSEVSTSVLLTYEFEGMDPNGKIVTWPNSKSRNPVLNISDDLG